jgi:adenine-specific DNA-methyltransferase
MDEVFGINNFVALIPFRKKTMPFGTKYIEQMCDFIIWYGKNLENGNTKYYSLFGGADKILDLI